jgi:hypothetical protein
VVNIHFFLFGCYTGAGSAGPALRARLMMRAATLFPCLDTTMTLLPQIMGDYTNKYNGEYHNPFGESLLANQCFWTTQGFEHGSDGLVLL